jgi:ectoine hydroxylase-related dioxygenase (phytanoyl-CoA dioxygenase family)
MPLFEQFTPGDTLSDQGILHLPGVLTPQECQDYIAALAPLAKAGDRQLLAIQAIAQLAKSARLLNIVAQYLPGKARLVRAIYFDKSPTVNWLVPWHQDLTIAVREKLDVPGYGPWSVKDGIPHVQPPTAVLEFMITLRIHLDDTDETNGALRVLPGTHRDGKLAAAEIATVREQVTEMICAATHGDAYLMRPLLLHASSRSTSDRHRRVLHFEYAGCELAGELAWYCRL